MVGKHRKQFNLPRALGLVAGLLFVLGSANVWYSDRRNDRYGVLLREGETKLSDPNVNKEQQVRYVRRLRARLAFYNTVENGGRIMVGIAIVLAVAIVWLPLKIKDGKITDGKITDGKITEDELADHNTRGST